MYSVLIYYTTHLTALPPTLQACWPAGLTCSHPCITPGTKVNNTTQVRWNAGFKTEIVVRKLNIFKIQLCQNYTSLKLREGSARRG